MLAAGFYGAPQPAGVQPITPQLCVPQEGYFASELLQQGERETPSGTQCYYFDYFVDNSARGQKRTYTVVAIANQQLYSFNGIIKCDKKAGCKQQSDSNFMQVFESVVPTFDTTA